MAACKVAVLLRHVSLPVCTKVSHQVSGADSKQRSKYRSMPLRASPSQLQPQKHLTAFDVTRVTPTFNTALQKSHCFCDCCGASFNIDGATSLKSHCSLCGCSNSLKV